MAKYNKNTKLTNYEGYLHEQGGIPVGGMAEVETGETRGPKDGAAKDYIFSDKLRYGGKLTFADASKKIDKKYSARKNDKLSDEQRELEINNLMNAQEQVRSTMIENAYKKAYGGKMCAFGGPVGGPGTLATKLANLNISPSGAHMLKKGEVALTPEQQAEYGFAPFNATVEQEVTYPRGRYKAFAEPVQPYVNHAQQMATNPEYRKKYFQLNPNAIPTKHNFGGALLGNIQNVGIGGVDSLASVVGAKNVMDKYYSKDKDAQLSAKYFDKAADIGGKLAPLAAGVVGTVYGGPAGGAAAMSAMKGIQGIGSNLAGDADPNNPLSQDTAFDEKFGKFAQMGEQGLGMYNSMSGSMGLPTGGKATARYGGSIPKYVVGGPLFADRTPAQTIPGTSPLNFGQTKSMDFGTQTYNPTTSAYNQGMGTFNVNPSGAGLFDRGVDPNAGVKKDMFGGSGSYATGNIAGIVDPNAPKQPGSFDSNSLYAAGNFLGAAYDIGRGLKGGDDVNYERVTPDAVDYSASRDMTRRDILQANRDLGQSLKGINNPQEYLRYKSQTTGQTQKNISDAIAKSYENEALANQADRRAVKFGNAPIQRAEADARQMEKDIAKNTLSTGLYNAGSATAQMGSDKINDKGALDAIASKYPDWTRDKKSGKWTHNTSKKTLSTEELLKEPK